jgi:hypothetical protein
MNRIRALIKEAQEILCHVRTKPKDTIYEPESGLSPVTTSAGALVLAFSASRTMRSKFLD